jgi:hypothetical protein
MTKPTPAITESTPKNRRRRTAEDPEAVLHIRHERRRFKDALLKRFPDLDLGSVPEWLTRPELAALLTALGFKISSKTLAQLASRAHRRGPPYVRFNNRALYGKDDGIAWAKSELSPKASSTSEHDDIARRAAA